MHVGNTTTTAGDSETPFAVAGTLSNFRARAAIAPGAGESVTFTVLKNGSDTGTPTCTVAEAAQDCTSGGNLAFSAGDRIAVRISLTATGSNGGNHWVATYTP